MTAWPINVLPAGENVIFLAEKCHKCGAELAEYQEKIENSALIIVSIIIFFLTVVISVPTCGMIGVPISLMLALCAWLKMKRRIIRLKKRSGKMLVGKDDL